MKKVCFLDNDRFYGSRRYFTQCFAEALEKKGIHTKIIDVDKGPHETIQGIQAYQPDLTASFCSLLSSFSDHCFWDTLKIPHLTLLLEPAIYSLGLTKSPYSLISSADGIDAKNIYDQGFSNIFLLPHAVEKDFSYGSKKNREYDLVFFGTCYDHESLQALWRKKFPKRVYEVIEKACERVLADNRTTIAEALTSAWEDSGLDPAEQDFLSLYFCVDYYTRGKDRFELIQAIDSVEVHLFGDLCEEFQGLMDWSLYFSSKKNVVVHPSVSYTESLEILKKSKICLNSMPYFKYGSHDRVFASLACGAVPLTMDNLFWQKFFVPDKELYLYDPAQKEAVNETIGLLLSDESNRRAVAERGREKVMRDHTWDVRADLFLKTVPEMVDNL